MGLQAKDGSKLELLLNANPKTDEHGMVTGMLCVAQVSIREHASLALLRFRKAC
jgi:hypothetical protein